MKFKRAPVYFSVLNSYFFNFLKFSARGGSAFGGKIFSVRNSPSIIVHLTRKDMGHEGRWLYLLLYFLASKKKEVALVRSIWNFKEYYRLGKYARLMFKIPNLCFLSNVPNPSSDVILVSDDSNYSESEKKKWKKFIYVDYDLSKSRKDLSEKDYVVLNPRMHPHSYANYSSDKFNLFRNSLKKVRVFFSGNLDKKAYSSNSLTDKFNLMPRHQLIESLKNLLGSKILLIDHSEGFEEILKTGRKDKFILDKNRFLPAKNWLSFLSSSDFFLCPPASHMPFSHNAVEAMAVGAIPLISYHDWFDPPLEHGKNCISFTDINDLVFKVEEILSMSQEKIAEMRKNILEYYEKFLSPESFWDSIEKIQSQNITLFYNVEDISILPKITSDSVVFGNREI